MKSSARPSEESAAICGVAMQGMQLSWTNALLTKHEADEPDGGPQWKLRIRSVVSNEKRQAEYRQLCSHRMQKNAPDGCA